MRRLFAIFLPLSLAAVLAADQLPRANTVVQPQAYVSIQPVPRGQTFELAVVAKIRPGFHINAHEVLQDYLIPTSLDAQLPAGFRVLETHYPPGVLRTFKFSKEKMSVYAESVTLRMKLQAPSDAALGAMKLPLVLHYQACNEEACLPPVKLPLIAEFEIAPAGTATRLAHPSIFAANAPAKSHLPK